MDYHAICQMGVPLANLYFTNFGKMTVYLVFTCLWLSSSEALVGNAKLDPLQFKVRHTFETMAKKKHVKMLRPY